MVRGRSEIGGNTPPLLERSHTRCESHGCARRGTTRATGSLLGQSVKCMSWSCHSREPSYSSNWGFLLPLVPLALPWRISSTSRLCLRSFGKRYRVGPLLPQYASLELYRALLGRTPHNRRAHPNCVRYICGDSCSGGSIGCAHLQHRYFTDLHVSRVHFQVSRRITLQATRAFKF